jgi:hypothetical protein
VGESVGAEEIVGDTVGDAVGDLVGDAVGDAVGAFVGALVGLFVGAFVGAGELDGAGEVVFPLPFFLEDFLDLCATGYDTSRMKDYP